MQETATNFLKSEVPSLLERFPEGIVNAEKFRGDLSLEIQPKGLREMIRFLKEEPSLDYTMLIDLFGMDYLKYSQKQPQRFAVIYILYSFSRHQHLRLKVYLEGRNPEIDSIQDLHACADWYEREAWDLYGIAFIGHPNLTRILCHSDFEGHPLRKDYPAEGYQRLKKPLPSTGF